MALTSKDPSVSNCPSTKGSQNTWETINTKDTSRYRKAMELLPELYSTRSEKDSNDAPAPPSDVVAKASYGCSPAIIVSWGHPEDMSWIDEYIISCTASLKETITNIRSSRDSKIEMQVDPGKSYVCSVASKGPHGQSAMVAASPVAYRYVYFSVYGVHLIQYYENELKMCCSFALACPPSQPTNVQASVSSSCPPEIHISWSAPDTDVEPIMYEVTCRGESKVSRVRVKAPVTSAMLGVDESVEYLCEVVSMSLSGTSNATYAPSSVMVRYVVTL